MNSVNLVGNLATDVELRELDPERKVASFLLAIDRPGNADADFVVIAAWNKQAEACQRFLTKGKRVAVDGRLRSRSWEEEGKRRSAIEVVANRVEFLFALEGAAEADIPFEAAAR
jgi:single-strand DNA-binding protein